MHIHNNSCYIIIPAFLLVSCTCFAFSILVTKAVCWVNPEFWNVTKQKSAVLVGKNMRGLYLLIIVTVLGKILNGKFFINMYISIPVHGYVDQKL